MFRAIRHNTMDTGDTTLTGSMKYTGCDLADLIPLTVESVQHFSDLVYAVKNPVFGLPSAMMYSTFRYTLSEMSAMTGSTSLLYLDPEIDSTVPERYKELLGVDKRNLEWCSNIQVHTIGNTASEILALPIGKSVVTTESDLVGFETPINISVELKRHVLHSLASEVEREQALRLLAAENEELAPRTRLLLSDLAIPLIVVRGCNTRECVEAVAHSVRLRKMYHIGSD